MPGGIGVGFCLVGGDDAEKAYVVALLPVLLIIIIVKQHKYTATGLRFAVMMMYCSDWWSALLFMLTLGLWIQ